MKVNILYLARLKQSELVYLTDKFSRKLNIQESVQDMK